MTSIRPIAVCDVASMGISFDRRLFGANATDLRAMRRKVALAPVAID